MKTKLTLYGLAMAGLTLASCAGSLTVSRSTVTPVDDIYYSPNKSYVVEERVEKPQREMTSSALKMAEIEQKYQEIISQDTTGKIDTVIYKAESTNPYERLLSDSYQESYERRLRGMEDPAYRMNNWSVYFSDDYWYATAFNPSFYNVIVMGNQVWVEPTYISSMFIWPRPYSGYSYYSYYWGRPYNSFYSSYWDSPWYYDPFALFGYYHGYNDGRWGNNYLPHNNVFLGSSKKYRPRTGGVNETTTIVERRRGGSVTPTTGIKSGVATTPRTRNTTRTGLEPTTRPRLGTKNSTHGELKSTERTRLNYNPKYNRPNTGNRGEFNRPNTGVVNNNQSTGRHRRGSGGQYTGTAPVYNNPGKVAVPSTSRGSSGSKGTSDRGTIGNKGGSNGSGRGSSVNTTSNNSGSRGTSGGSGRIGNSKNR